ncbi:AraC-like DNA-binding protein [Pseudomonas sp. BIGb0408]|uniref:AraC-like DNA-binding protein n=1 Tax=Phytopseudomonas flavescens TaxID=29435 RepID=A0A7Z0BR24_9GAMM|nr:MULTISPECIES: AraC family transcriptional regulator [Pseudomonas]MCW2291683.1 AraC-like DNA-binding protein [Pseudomonas sp. BIGb0408]NYH73746.1 AraC-like DNA-binding protein [Pseudomonas flavescens]
MYTMTSTCFQVMAKTLLEQGIDPSKLDHQLVVALSRGAPIRLVQVYGLFSQATEQANNPDIGLATYVHAHPSILGAQCYSIMSSPTLGCALKLLADFHPLTSNGSHILLEQGHGTLKLVGLEVGTAPTPAPRAFIDAGAALTLGLIHWLTPHEKPMPLAAEFTYPQPENTERLQQLFGENLRFSAPHNSLTFHEKISDYTLPTADEALHVMHQEYAQARLDDMVNGSIAARVVRLLVEQLTQGLNPSLSEIADTLSMSKRSLQHALERETVSFTQLLEESRLKLAHNFLRNSNRSLKYISATLGFRDQSSFHKASMRWFGMPPSQYRNRQEEC